MEGFDGGACCEMGLEMRADKEGGGDKEALSVGGGTTVLLGLVKEGRGAVIGWGGGTGFFVVMRFGGGGS